jgi:hypothetical protein
VSNQRTSNGRDNPPREEQQEKTGPIFSREAWTGTGKVCVAVFDRKIKGDNGEYRLFNILVKRVWRNPDEKANEKWLEGNNFRPEDILILALFLQEAASFICTEQSRQ